MVKMTEECFCCGGGQSTCPECGVGSKFYDCCSQCGWETNDPEAFHACEGPTK